MRIGGSVDRIGYYVFDEYKSPDEYNLPKRVRAQPMQSPARNYDASFEHLYDASRQFAGETDGPDLSLARQEGWVFKSIAEFLQLALPIKGRPIPVEPLKSESA